ACLAGAVVALLRPTRGALAVAAIGAAILAASKQQHLVLALLLGLALLVAAGTAGRRAALAVLAGGVLGFALQLGDIVRAPSMSHGIDVVNRANFVLGALLPESSDPARVADVLALEPGCVAYAGRSVYAMPGPVGRVCSEVTEGPRLQPW